MLTSAKDLEGKKVGMVRGAGVLIAFRNMANDLGVDINKVQFINIGPADQLAALDQGDISAAYRLGRGLDPWVTLLAIFGAWQAMSVYNQSHRMFDPVFCRRRPWCSRRLPSSRARANCSDTFWPARCAC